MTPAPAPLVVALMGLPGAGKSTLAQALMPALGLHLVCRDRIRAALFPDPSFDPLEKQAAFRAVLAAINALIRQGRSCVVDGLPFSLNSERRALARLATALDCRILWLWLDCPEQLAKQRIALDHGTHPMPDRGPHLVAEVAARFAPVGPEVFRLDARWPVPALVEQSRGLVGGI